MTNIAVDHPWSKDALFAKAKLYVSKMEEHPADQWEFGFWSALALESLARAALAHMSPILLADAKNDWRNITHAMGEQPTTKKFSPKSITTNEVLNRLDELLPEFTKELAGFCTKHANQRNAELHTGELAFEGIGTSSWLPKFYAASKVLLESMGHELADLVDDPDEAENQITVSQDEAAKAVTQDIKAHAKVWSNKSKAEKADASAKVLAWATRHNGHRVDCPSCASRALVLGNPSGSVTTIMGEDEVVERQTMFPASFECLACGLRISGMSKLSAAGLGDAFTAKSTYSAANYFGLYTEDDLDEARAEGHYEDPAPYEEDFNEY